MKIVLFTLLLFPAYLHAQSVELGHHLFFDKRLSFNGTKSCASCHDPKLAYTDGYRRSFGATADHHKHNSPTLLNISKVSPLTVDNPHLRELEDQIVIPLFNKEVIELGAHKRKEGILSELKDDTLYGEEITWKIIIKSLALYLRELNSYNSLYDKYLETKDDKLFSKEELEGKKLFFSKKLKCGDCHNGLLLNTTKKGERFSSNGFTTKKLRIPTLRNVAITDPYMHDGSVRTLLEVIEGYDSLHSLSLKREEKKALLDFLGTLTDLTYLENPLFVEPKKKIR